MLPWYLDADYAITKFAGAGVTPEAVVVDAKGEVRYQGRIDNRYVDFGKYRAEATQEDLSDALNAVLNGQDVKEPCTKAIGCFIEIPKGNADDEE